MIEYVPTAILILGATIVFMACCYTISKACFTDAALKADIQLAFYWAVAFALVIVGSIAITESLNTTTASIYSILICFISIVGGKLLAITWRKTEASDAAQMDELRNLVAGYREKDQSIEYRCAQAARDFGLTRREEDILRLLLEGCTRKEMSHRLYLSDNTVKTHIRNLYRKIGVADKDRLIKRI